jgi:hypothetical protein
MGEFMEQPRSARAETNEPEKIETNGAEQGSGVQLNPTDETDSRSVIRNRIGQYDIGTVGGPGNPFGRHVARNRQLLFAYFTEDKLLAIFKKVETMATEGNVGAQRLLMQYLIGKPQPAPNPDRVNHEEWELRREQPHMEEVAMQAHSQLPHAAVLVMQRVADEAKLEKLEAEFRNGAIAAKAAAAKQAARAERRQQRKEERRRRRQGG